MKQLLTAFLITTILYACRDKSSGTFDLTKFNVKTISSLINENLDDLPVFFISGMGDDYNLSISNTIKDAYDELKKYNNNHVKKYKIIDIDLQNISYDSQVLKYVAVIKVKVLQ